ncbi:hypothetical protein SADUNF_Sadunf14G0018900 [Salix dunnii]|uniref:Uncharacterized protein n=1 Tax=Salix dunnii TaxID=1413687 RepID=A0A835MLS5_9ROSI|nr:hypothetical protein SADUNF_Sadunf14G0018900 [Salix dunnii]
MRIGGFLEELKAFPAGLINSIQHLNLSGSLESLWIYEWDKLKSRNLRKPCQISLPTFLPLNVLVFGIARILSIYQVQQPFNTCQN